ncbi:sensor histidine kinase [Ramlibacter alkalitolerans]|uniref:histidine kinase n=1 Tax=Ramlibacter alkalitolerans TaxID=2039631 RepID=A0ABS1JI26_9BURK|nr:HAMP domain-containing sensor histidine kinase [Ramlibacter alkalitolerans]MBL0423868.1 HAMP domain-containing histidine kinase [Ramlibacter alkalitolerans]
MNEDLHRPSFSPTPARAVFDNLRYRLRKWATAEVLAPIADSILHPSHWRIRALGFCTLVGHPLFYGIWAFWLPQPYENLWLRLLMAVGGAALLAIAMMTHSPPSRAAGIALSGIFWLTLPWFFTWMYFCNSGNAVWLASMAAMLLIYYQLTDWRLATVGAAGGVLLAWLAFANFGPSVPPVPSDAANTVVLAFCWFMSIILGVSTSNVRREQLNSTLDTMGIMAHELRTPLATMQLIGEALRNEAPAHPGEAGERLEQLAQRVHNLVRNMNHQIDMQMTNARLMRLAAHAERLSAAELVQRAITNYPFRSSRERQCVVIRVYGDFHFVGSERLFLQVIDNLTKNALRSLAAAFSATRPGDLLIEIGAHGARGRIVFTDNGVGMEPELQARIFQPFFSTDRGTGHGLGLAFCQRVVQAAQGTIRVKSARHHGAVFTVELPVA